MPAPTAMRECADVSDSTAWQRGDRIRMVLTTEIRRPVPVGTMGTVRLALYFPIGNPVVTPSQRAHGWWLLHMIWDNLPFEQGQSLSVCIPPDVVTLVERTPWWWQDVAFRPEAIRMILTGSDPGNLSTPQGFEDGLAR